MKATGISLFYVNAHIAGALLFENFLYYKDQPDIQQAFRKIDKFF